MALDKYDDDADKVAPGGKLGFDALPDGEYTFDVDDAELKETKNGTDLFKLKLLGLDGAAQGQTFEHDYWLTNKDKETEKIVMNDVKIGMLKKDLETLGFDTPEWKKEKGRPLSKELAKAVKVLEGMRLKGKKTTNGKYANFHIVARVTGTDGKPEKIGPKELNAANEQPFSVD